MPGIDEAVGQAVESAEMTLVHPVSGEPLVNDDESEMTITVAGLDSPRYKEVAHRQQDARLQAAQRRQGAPLSAAKIERDALELLAECVISWRITLGGSANPPCNKDAAVSLFKTYPWVREQVDRFVHDRRSFLGNSSTASKSGRKKSSG